MTPKRPRKPATILRELRAEVSLVECFSGTTFRNMRALLAELSRAIATSGKAPGRP